MIRRLTLVVTFAVAVCSAEVRAQDAPAAQAWGYLYTPRTLHLYELDTEENRIGRRVSNDVVLTSPRVSREHALIRRSASGVEIVDVGSSNGSKLNGTSLRPNVPAALHPGDRIELADELLLYDTSLDSLWLAEITSRLLTSIVRLNLSLPQDETRKSFGREEIVPAVTEATLDSESGVEVVDHQTVPEPGRGFPKGSGAFVGNVEIDGQTLVLSLWTIARGDSMTGRRASLSNLKHTTLRISAAKGSETQLVQGPWFSPQYLGTILETFPEETDFTLRFCHSLASQERPVALRDAAAALSYRHSLEPDEWKLLVLASRSAGLWVEGEIAKKRNRLSPRERSRLSESITEASGWLMKARELGAEDAKVKEAAEILSRTLKQLEELEAP
jgi:pSer/pThr/pTyr-binding forkhead associated (FHA) protein